MWSEYSKTIHNPLTLLCQYPKTISKMEPRTPLVIVHQPEKQPDKPKLPTHRVKWDIGAEPYNY